LRFRGSRIAIDQFWAAELSPVRSKSGKSAMFPAIKQTRLIRFDSLLVFLIVLAGYRDCNHVAGATSSKLTTGTGDQNDAIALALASNMTATDLDVSEMAVARHRCHRLVHSHTLKIHGWITSLRSIGSKGGASHEIQ